MDTLYRLNRLAMFLAMLLYVPLTVAVAGALLGAVYLLGWSVIHWAPTAHSPRGFAGIMIFVLLVSLSAGGAALLLLAGLFKLFGRLRSEPGVGVVLSTRQHKPFFELLDRVCRKLKVRPPEQCVLSPFSEMSIGDRHAEGDGKRAGRRVRTLTVGAGLLVHIRIDELTTILAHEMAHAKAGDTRLCWLAERFNRALVGSIVDQAEEESQSASSTWLNTGVRIGLMLYFRVFNLMYAVDQRWRELRADRMAARICGPQNLRNALIKTHLAGYVPELSIESLLVEYCESARDMQNLYDEHRRRWEQLPVERIQAAENEMFLDRHSLYDSHPCLSVRIRGLKGIEASEVRGEKPATRLFTDWEGLSSLMTQWLMRRGRLLYRGYMGQVLGGR